MGAHVENTPHVVGSGLMHPFGESPSHEGFQENTHSSQTSGYCSAESASEMYASTLNASKVVDQQENPVEAFKRIIENQEVFSELSPNSLPNSLDNYSELFRQLKSKLIGIDFLQTVRDDSIALFDIQGILAKLSKPDVPYPIGDIILDLKPLLEQVVQVVRKK